MKDAATSPNTKGMPSAVPAEAIARPKWRRGQVQDEVSARIRRGLMVGAYVPGQIMSLRKMAAHLGTSPMPVREALSQLVAANALEAMPNRSVRVPRLTPSRLKELAEVRSAIEGMATRNACENVTPDLIAELEAINDRLTKAISRRDIVGCLETNQEFHFRLYEAAESEVMMPLIEALWLQCGPTLCYSLLAPNMPWDASIHIEILDALRQRDAAMAQRAMARDIRTTAKYLLNVPMLSGGEGPLSRTLDTVL